MESDSANTFGELQFTYVDKSRNPQAHLDYLDRISAIPDMLLYKKVAYELMRLADGSSVLDVGCGTGEDLAELAACVGAGGSVMGIDASEAMIARARSHIVAQTITCQVMDVLELEFEDGIFDAVRADRVIPYVTQPLRALEEMARVTRQGGRVVVASTDWGSLVVTGDNRSLTRKILEFRCDTVVHGWMARRFPALLQRIGLDDVDTRAVAIMVRDFSVADQVFGLTSAAQAMAAQVRLDPLQAERWVGDARRAASDGSFMAVVTGIIASGVKP